MHTESYVYLLANKHNNVLYTGVTSDLIRRVYEHKNKLVKGFTQKCATRSHQMDCLNV